MTFFHKEILVTGAGRPHSLKDKLKGKTILDEQRELRNQRRVYDLRKNGQTTQEDHKDVVSLCREKIKTTKAQLKLNPATLVKDNKNVSKKLQWQKKEG